MTDLRLLLSIGIPSLLIALSIFQNNTRFTSLEKRMGGVDKRVDGVEGRFNRFETELREFRAEHRKDLMGLYEDLKQFYGMTPSSKAAWTKSPSAKRPSGSASPLRLLSGSGS